MSKEKQTGKGRGAPKKAEGESKTALMKKIREERKMQKSADNKDVKLSEPKEQKPSLDEIQEVKNDDLTTNESEINEDVIETENSSSVNNIPEINDIPDSDIKKLNLDPEFFEENVPDDVFNPLSKNVIEREYTKGNDMSAASETQDQSDSMFSDGEQKQLQAHVPPQTKKRKEKDNSSPVSDSGEDNFGSDSFSDEQTQEDDIADNDGKMTDKEKRKNIKKTTEILLTAYERLFPIPFLYITTISEKKLIVMQRNNEITVEMVVQSDGTTIRSYIDQYNERCVDVFTVTEAMKDEIRPALFDYLMEKGIELTPLQRLLLAIGNQVVVFSQEAFKLRSEMGEALDSFKKFHLDMMGRTQSPPINVQQQEEKKETIKTESVKTEEKKETIPPIDDFLNGKN